MFCTHCGCQLTDDARFCKQCGQPTRAAAEAVRAEAPTPAQPANPQVQPSYEQPAQPDNTANSPAAGAAPLVYTQAPPAQPAPKKKMPFWALVAIPAAVTCLLAAGITMLVLNPPNISPRDSTATNAQDSEAARAAGVSVSPSVTIDGKEVKAIARPQIIKVLPEPAMAAVTPTVASYTIEPGLANVATTKQTSMQDSVKSVLSEHGFAIAEGSYYEFHEAYERNRYMFRRNFVTTDSLMHTYHLYFAHLLKKVESNYLYNDLAAMSKAMLEASTAQYEQLKGTEWEEAAKRNMAFFAVGACLQDPATAVPTDVSSAVSAELASINAANTMADSPITGALEDYTQYVPRGYYEETPTLQAYFRTMMWYGRMNFTQKDESLDRSALLMTIALNEGSKATWESIYALTSFFAGASDDCGYYEYMPLIDAIYGEGATAKDLVGNDGAWKRYHELTAEMPAPQINSMVVEDKGEGADHTDDIKGYRFMGQRFTIDANIMQYLVYSQVGKNSAGGTREMPDALDVPAAMGSDEALGILESQGATDYDKYPEHMDELRQTIDNAPDTLWSGSLYSQWLYTLKPLLEPKGEGYPTFMQSPAWMRKNLQTYLGSYTELKHDTVLYAKQMMVEMGGGPEPEDDRGYVEPEPDVFSRLASLTDATSTGLASYGKLDAEDQANLDLLESMTRSLATIATKELSGEAITAEEYELIRTIGGQLEHFWEEVHKNEAGGKRLTTREYPAAIVTDIATNPNMGSVLEIGTGMISTMYVVVPIDGQLHVASGPVYSFYQFEQPQDQRLTDTTWREMMGIEQASDGKYHKESKIQPPSWIQPYVIPSPY